MEVLLIPILSALAVVALAVAVDNSAVIFDPIQVPPEWQNRGYTSEVVSYRLTDAIRRMNEEADTSKRGRGVRLGTDKTVTRELGGYLGLAAPIWIMRKEMGLIEFTVGGEIVLVDKDKSTYQFLLRSSNYSAKVNVLTSTECGSIDRPDELIQLGAEEALRVIGPYILASYYFDSKEDAYYEARKKSGAEDTGDDPKPDVGDKEDRDNTCGGKEKNVGPFHQTVRAIKHSLATMPEAEHKWPYENGRAIIPH